MTDVKVPLTHEPDSLSACPPDMSGSVSLTSTVTGQVDVSPTPSAPGNELTPRLCACGCGRQATKASGYTWAYWCDPAVSAETKLQARQLGGRRGQMTPAEAIRLFDQLEPSSAESRTTFRLKLMELLSVGRLTGSMYRDLLAGLEGMSKDHERQGKPAAPGRVVVEVQRFAGNGQQPAQEPAE